MLLLISKRLSLCVLGLGLTPGASWQFLVCFYCVLSFLLRMDTFTLLEGEVRISWPFFTLYL